MIRASWDREGRYFIFKNLREVKEFCMEHAQASAPREIIRWDVKNRYWERIQVKKAVNAPYWKF